jgi:hypothetical protein
MNPKNNFCKIELLDPWKGAIDCDPCFKNLKPLFVGKII